MRIPSAKTDQLIYFVAYDITDLVTRKTGLTTFTVYRSRNGAAATAYTTPTVAELSAANMPGIYSLAIDEDTTIASTSDSEEYVVHITQASMAPVTRTIELYRRSVTTGVTLDVSATGEAGLDFDNIKSTSLVTLNSLTVTGATTLTGAVSLGSTLGITGTTTLAALTQVGAVSLGATTIASAAITGALSVGTTTTLSGNVTLSGAAGLAVTNGITANITGNLVGTVSTTTNLTTNNDKTGYALSSAGVTAVWAEVVAGTTTAVQAMRGFIAAMLGKASGLPTAPVYRNIADTKDVITATTDTDGNRTAITLDLT